MLKKLRWQILVVLLTLVVVGALLLTEEPGEQIFAPQPAEGGIYSEALIGSFGRLNPLLDQNNPADRDIDHLIFSSLVKFDARGLPIPDLAESWGVSLDGTIYNFSLRPNAFWHDGQPVTVEDVLFTIELIKADSSFFTPDVREIWRQTQIKELPEHKLQFILPEPFAPFLDYLTFGILPRHLLDDTPPDQLAASAFNLSPVGSGPYRFERLIIENGQVLGVELRAFDRYFGQKAYMETAIFRYYPTSAAGLDAYREGQVLAIGELTADVLPQALADPSLNIYSGRLPELSMVLFNLNNPEVPFLQDVKVRRALLMGLNRQQIVDKLLAGQGILADGPIFPDTWAYYDGLEHVIYDPEAAIDLLKNSKYVIPASGDGVRVDSNGAALRFTLLHPDDPLRTGMAEIIQKNWALLGVQVDLQALPYDALVNERLVPRNYQAALVDLNLSDEPDPDPYPFWHQSEITGGQNYSQWNDRAASEFLEQARTNPDFAARERLYRNFQVIFERELPALPLFYPVYSFGAGQQVLGVQIPPLFNTSDRFQTMPGWYLVTRRVLETPVP